MNLSKRARRCLKRILDNKSIPDIGAMDELETKGMITCAYGDGEMSVTVTNAGMTALLPAAPRQIAAQEQEKRK